MDTLSDSDRAKATFVFVTPRSAGSGGWTEPKQTEWKSKRQDKGWRQIRIIDGVKLADWLREFPAIGRWMATRACITSRLGGIRTPREYWDLEIPQGNVDDPHLPPELFVAGRAGACNAIEAVFNGKSPRLFLFAEDEHDVNDFVAAFLNSLDEEKGRVYAERCLYITHEDAWRSVVELRRRHILVASPRLGLDADNENLQTVATTKGHGVIIPLCGAWSGKSSEIIKLRSPSQSQIETILKEAGFADLRARYLAGVGGDRISALRREMLGLGTLPPYATWGSARQLAQAGLVGKWDGTSEADRTAIGELLGKVYGEWIEALRHDVLRSDAPLIQRDEKWRLVARGEAWGALGNRITDDDLDRLNKVTVTVLGERDPQFDLPRHKRFAANIYGKQRKHSSLLRAGLTETLALVGCKSEALTLCSEDKAEFTAILTVRELLRDADWERWASLDPHLPLLAEAAPDEFLDSVESALVNLNRTPFHEIYSQEGRGVLGGSNYMTGLLWALETLAWDPEHLSRVAIILADLASIDPGGNWANRPANSMTEIFLPWHVQTTASLERRKIAINNVLHEHPDIGWKLLVSLLPNNYSSAIGCRLPVWRDYLPISWDAAMTTREYWEQITTYSGLLVGHTKENPKHLSELIRYLPDLPKPAHESVLTHLKSKEVVNLSEADRLPLWEHLDKLVRKHRKFSGAKWALSEEYLLKIETVKNGLAPELPELKYQRLFGNRDFDLYEETENFDEQRKRLDEERKAAVQTIVERGGVQGVLRFALSVALPFQVGRAFGDLDDEELETNIIPALLVTEEDTEKQVLAGYVRVRHWNYGWKWVDRMLRRIPNEEQKVKFLLFLPFEMEVWHRVSTQLTEQSAGHYWRNVEVYPYGVDGELTVAIEKLLEYKRPAAAVLCVHETMRHGGKRFDEDIATRALRALLGNQAELKHLDHHGIVRNAVEVIKHLQGSSTLDENILFEIEWSFLPWLDRFSEGSPVTLHNRMASYPAFFAEIVSLVFCSKKGNQDDGKTDKPGRNLVRNAYALLTEWSVCPGTQADGSFSVLDFNLWLGEAKRITEETGHAEVAQIQIGHVLTHAVPDPNGLWIHEAVAKVLNGRDAEPMRSGFTIELSNQRGVHGYTAGQEELEIAIQYRRKADELESKGFSRFATAMRELARRYERDAEREAKRNPYIE